MELNKILKEARTLGWKLEELEENKTFGRPYNLLAMQFMGRLSDAKRVAETDYQTNPNPLTLNIRNEIFTIADQMGLSWGALLRGETDKLEVFDLPHHRYN